MNHQTLIAICLLFVLAETVDGQDSLAKSVGKVIFVSGEVRDSKTHAPVPSATISLKNGSAITATNTLGRFVFKVPAAFAGDTLFISSIGFSAVAIPLSQAVSTRHILLVPASIELPPVTVEARTALGVLKEVLRRIPENYDTADVEFTAFYRENIRLGSVQLAFSEAVLQIYRTFLPGKKLNDQIRVIKGRKKKTDYGREGQLYHWMSGASNGARGSLSEDMIKYRNAVHSPFNPENFRFYNYRFNGTIRANERNLVVIDVDPKPKARKGYLRMKLFIDEESLALIKYNFELTPQGRKMVSRKDKGIAYSIMSKIVSVRTDYHRFQYDVSFNQYQDKWYLNRVTRHWEILVSSNRRNWVDSLWQADMDLVVTNIKTDSISPIAEGDIGTNEAPMTSLIDDDFDEAFWEDYNSVPGSPPAPQPEINNFKSTGLMLPMFNRAGCITMADNFRGLITGLETGYDLEHRYPDVAVSVENRSVIWVHPDSYKKIQCFNKISN